MTWSRAMGLEAARVAVRFVRTHTPSHTLVDPFCGVGTALAVANAEGLHALGVELSARRVRKARTLHLDALSDTPRASPPPADAPEVSRPSTNTSAPAVVATTRTRPMGRSAKDIGSTDASVCPPPRASWRINTVRNTPEPTTAALNTSAPRAVACAAATGGPERLQRHRWRIARAGPDRPHPAPRQARRRRLLRPHRQRPAGRREGLHLRHRRTVRHTHGGGVVKRVAHR
jgi:hypothetical protein